MKPIRDVMRFYRQEASNKEAEMARTLIQTSIAGATGAVLVTLMVTVMAFTGAFS